MYGQGRGRGFGGRGLRLRKRLHICWRTLDDKEYLRLRKRALEEELKEINRLLNEEKD